MAKSKGIQQGPQPSDPTGRLVFDPPTKTGPAVHALHWCPDAKKTGVYAWKCPDCGAWFSWSVDHQCWQASTAEAAQVGLFR